MTILDDIFNGASDAVKAVQKANANHKLIKLVRAKDYAGVKEALALGADPNKVDENGTPVLNIAASVSTVEIVRLLLDAGSGINRKSSYGDTPLMAAAQASQVTVMKLLIEKGADIEARNSNGDTALIIAAGNRRPQDGLTLLIASKAKLNRKNNSGDTALIRAARGAHFENAKVLIESGADIDLHNKYAETALGLAKKYYQKELVKLFETTIAAREHLDAEAEAMTARAADLQKAEAQVRRRLSLKEKAKQHNFDKGP